MSSQKINISSSNVSGKCELKCAYSFKYPDTSLSATNKGDSISFTCDKDSSYPVMYNDNKYYIQSIDLVSSSFQNFNNMPAKAELIITHYPMSRGPKLHVAIPIIMSTNLSESTAFLTEIITAVATSAPAKNNSTNLNISDFNLNKIIPSKPFFSYTDTNQEEWIVYGLSTAITLSESTLTTLNQIITATTINSYSDTGVYFNSLGPNTISSNDSGIYISCQPTGNSEEEMGVLEKRKNIVNYELLSPSFIKNMYMYLLFALSIVLLYFALYVAFYYFMGPQSKTGNNTE